MALLQNTGEKMVGARICRIQPKMQLLSSEICWYTAAKQPSLRRLKLKLKLFEEPKMTIDLKELISLPLEEKLRLVEFLWDDIGASGESIVLHPSHATEVRRRSAELKSDPSIAIDRDELWRRVDG